MTSFVKKLLLIPFGLLLGGFLTAGVVALWLAIRPSVRPIAASDQPKLREQLDYNPNALFMYDEDVSYRLKPNYRGIRHDTPSFPHVTNSVGLLGEKELDPDPKVRKILVLGDSVTYGDGVPLEAVFISKMQQLAGDSYQIANAGTPGWSTLQEFKYFDKYLSNIEWDAVVIVFCLNDLIRYEWVYGGESGFIMSDEIKEFGGRELTNNTQAGLRLAGLRLRMLGAGAKLLARQQNAMLYAWDETKWKTFENDVLMPFVTRQHRPHLVFVIAPSLHQLVELSHGTDRSLVLYPQEHLRAFCERQNLAFVDLSEAFADAPSLPDLYIDDIVHVHFSEAGHQRVAEYLWPRLQENLAEKP